MSLASKTYFKSAEIMNSTPLYNLCNKKQKL